MIRTRHAALTNQLSTDFYIINSRHNLLQQKELKRKRSVWKPFDFTVAFIQKQGTFDLITDTSTTKPYEQEENCEAKISLQTSKETFIFKQKME